METLEDRTAPSVGPVTYTTIEQFNSGTYTIDADFDRGVQFNVNHNAPNNDQLQLNPVLTTFPVMWIANAGEDTLSKIDTTTGQELARYKTWFGPAGQPGFFNHYNDAYSGAAPSRTAVDRDGNVYVANRHFDNKPASVMKILATGGIDRNGNGVIDTSADLNGNGRIGANGPGAPIYDTGEIFPLPDTNGNGRVDPEEIQDERIAWIVEVGPNGGLGRSLAIDVNGNIWVGLYNSQAYYKLDGQTGAILAGPIATPGHTPYGAVVDGNGILWGASLSSTLLRLDTNTQAVQVLNHAAYGGDYGIAIGSGKVYMATYSGRTYIQYDPATGNFSNPAAQFFSALGVATDSVGNVIAGKDGGGVAKFAPDGSLIWSVGGQPGTSHVRGVVVDSDDNVWLIHLNDHRISKHRGTDGAPLGVFEVGNSPYTYTDATGLTRFTETNPSGKWTVVHDGGELGQVWNNIVWNTEPEARVPEGTSITVVARAADTQAALGGQTFIAIQNGQPFNLVGRYIEVQVTLTANNMLVSPVLSDITIGPGGGRGVIRGQVFIDSNNNGRRERKELAIPDVLVTLLFLDSQGNPTGQTRTTTTDLQGKFSFTNLTPGRYRIIQSQPTFLLDGKDSSRVPGAQVANDDIAFTLTTNQDAFDNNFGERGLNPRVISKRLYLALLAARRRAGTPTAE